MKTYYLPPDGMYDQDLNQVGESVIKLHDAARILENQYGVCDLSREIRALADKVSAHMRYY